MTYQTADHFEGTLDLVPANGSIRMTSYSNTCTYSSKGAHPGWTSTEMSCLSPGYDYRESVVTSFIASATNIQDFLKGGVEKIRLQGPKGWIDLERMH